MNNKDGEKNMVIRRHYPVKWSDQDIDEMRNEIRSRFDRFMSSPLLPPGSFIERIVPGLLGEFRVDVAEQDDEIIVVADLPGVNKEDVDISLINPGTLEIKSERKTEKEEEEEGYYMKERSSGSMCRVIQLPHDVTEAGASATFRNGVLEMHFRKINIERGKKIRIE